MNTLPLEAETRVLIDKTLENLGWRLSGRDKNVFFEQPRTTEEQSLLGGRRPDYVLYASAADSKPLIVIEAKKKGTRIESALQQGISYARKLKAPLVFATDGLFCKAYHTKFECAPVLNGEELDRFPREGLALKYLKTPEVNTVSEKVQIDRRELIKVFDEANNMLRGDGLRAGIERFGEFANILFLKLISESEDDKKQSGRPTGFDYACHWDVIRELRPDTRIDYINKVVYEKLNALYRTRIFTPLTIRDTTILSDIMDKLGPLTLTDVDSDVKGDAFEYFLKESTAAKNDLGEYFTPRHIVRTMVKIVNPQIGEKVYDPFCGTGGFLIESYRHIWNTMPQNDTTVGMLRDDTIFGNEITNTARITKMNMILAGGGQGNIHMRDSLASPVDGRFDIVLANMPYSQKTKYGGLYDLPSNNGDSVCVQHCMKAVSATAENGRMAIVVPEGFLFRRDLVKTRELLLREFQINSIISMPRGVFLPYTGVKTNIIYASRKHRGGIGYTPRDSFWYYEAKNDGYTLDNHRRKLHGQNDLDRCMEYRRLDINQREEMLAAGFQEIPLASVKENGFVLVGGRYRSIMAPVTSGRKAKLGDIIDIKYGKRITRSKDSGTSFPVYGGGGISFQTDLYNRENEFVVSRFGVSERCVRFVEGRFYLLDSGFTFDVKPEYSPHISKDYVGRLLMGRQREIFACARGQAQKNIDLGLFSEIEIPLPGLEEQQKIARELEEYDQISTHASQAALKYRPRLLVANNTVFRPIGELCTDDTSGGTPSTKHPEYWNGDIPWITSADIEDNGRIVVKKHITYQGLQNSATHVVPKGQIIVATRVGLGKIAYVPYDIAISQDLHGLYLDTKQVIPQFFELAYLGLREEILRHARGTTIRGITVQELFALEIPVPPLEEQMVAVTQAKREREMIRSAHELSVMLKNKRQKRIDYLYLAK